MSLVTNKMTGIALAVAAAGILGGCATDNTTAGTSSQAAATTDLVHCYGVNTCKGHNDCGGTGNSCAGQGSCKGTGFVGIPSKACADLGGSTQGDNWTGQIAVADLSHCHGVNVCKGHNDCAGASNSCAGQGSCKGTGFVAIPAKACADVGGTVRS